MKNALQRSILSQTCPIDRHSMTLACLRCEFPNGWGLFVLDIDNLKVTNDTFGLRGGRCAHPCGSKPDISFALSPDVTFRTGGDEFRHHPPGSRGIARPVSYRAGRSERSTAVGANCPSGDSHGHSRITIGGAVLAPQDSNLEAGSAQRRLRLYRMKHSAAASSGIGPGIGTRMALRPDSIRDVAEALREGRIDAQYQPVLRLDSGLIVGFEALSRMTNAAGRSCLLRCSRRHLPTRMASELTGSQFDAHHFGHPPLA